MTCGADCGMRLTSVVARRGAVLVGRREEALDVCDLHIGYSHAITRLVRQMNGRCMPRWCGAVQPVQCCVAMFTAWWSEWPGMRTNVEWACTGAGKSGDRLIYRAHVGRASPLTNLAALGCVPCCQRGTVQDTAPHSEDSKTVATHSKEPNRCAAARVPCRPKEQQTSAWCTGETGIYIIFSYCVMFPAARAAPARACVGTKQYP